MPAQRLRCTSYEEVASVVGESCSTLPNLSTFESFEGRSCFALTSKLISWFLPSNPRNLLALRRFEARRFRRKDESLFAAFVLLPNLIQSFFFFFFFFKFPSCSARTLCNPGLSITEKERAGTRICTKLLDTCAVGVGDVSLWCLRPINPEKNQTCEVRRLSARGTD